MSWLKSRLLPARHAPGTDDLKCMLAQPTKGDHEHEEEVREVRERLERLRDEIALRSRDNW